MNEFKRLYKKAKKAGRKIDRARLGGIKKLIQRTAGGRNLGVFGFKRGTKTMPKTVRQTAGLPGTGLGGESGCQPVDPNDGSHRRPYVLIGRIQLAASAQAVATNLADFLDAANVDDITTDNVIPFGVFVYAARLFVQSNELIASPIFNLAMAAGMYIRWLVNGIEEARWPLTKFNPLFGERGLVTSGAGSTVAKIDNDSVPFEVYFDPDKTFEANLYTTKAVTPAAVVDMTWILEGER